jgi:hypothetical protein
LGEHVDLPKQTLYASILWRGAQEDAARFLASDWLWQSERRKDGDHLYLLRAPISLSLKPNEDREWASNFSDGSRDWGFHLIGEMSYQPS